MELPPPLGKVRLPAFFAPSQLWYAQSCALRVVGTRAIPSQHQLAAGPRAARGLLLHRLIEHAIRGDPDETLEKMFEHELAELGRDLARVPSAANYTNLRVTLSSREWAVYERRAIERARKARQERISQGATTGVRFQQTPLFAKSGRWAEVPIRDTALRIDGRIDELEVTPARILIRDYKSGRVLDRSGEIRPDYVFQLLIYGLAISALRPGIAVELRLNDGVDHIVLFNEERIADTTRRLAEISARLPPDLVVDASSLASPGAACQECSIRPSCSKYLAEAASRWRVGTTTDERLPNDIWGEVLQVADRDASFDVTLRDAAGRQVKLLRIDTRHHGETGFSPGQSIWAFTLSADRNVGRDGLVYHPWNFYELPGDPGDERAWTTVFFDASAEA